MPPNFNRKKLEDWSSALYELSGPIESYSLPINSDGHGWEYTDVALNNILPDDLGGNFVIAIANVPIEDNYFARVLSEKKMVFTFYETKEI